MIPRAAGTQVVGAADQENIGRAVYGALHFRAIDRFELRLARIGHADFVARISFDRGFDRQLCFNGRNLGFASAVVLALVIALLFRNLRWIILPLAVVHLTLIWTKASLVLTGSQLSMVSSPLVALVTVIGAEIGLLTPPLGISCFVIKATLDDPSISLKDVFLGALPFAFIMLLVLVLIIRYPALSIGILG